MQRALERIPKRAIYLLLLWRVRVVDRVKRFLSTQTYMVRIPLLLCMDQLR